jgi:hypothetical protein
MARPHKGCDLNACLTSGDAAASSIPELSIKVSRSSSAASIPDSEPRPRRIKIVALIPDLAEKNLNRVVEAAWNNA